MKRLCSFLLALLALTVLTVPAGAEELAVEAEACLLMEKTTGEVLYAVNEHEPLEPASAMLSPFAVCPCNSRAAVSYTFCLPSSV